MNMLEVKLEGLALDMTTNTPVVILSPSGLDKVLPSGSAMPRRGRLRWSCPVSAPSGL